MIHILSADHWQASRRQKLGERKKKRVGRHGVEVGGPMGRGTSMEDACVPRAAQSSTRSQRDRLCLNAHQVSLPLGMVHGFAGIIGP